MPPRKLRNQRRLKQKRRRRSSRPLKKILLRTLESKQLSFMETQKESWKRPRFREKMQERLK